MFRLHPPAVQSTLDRLDQVVGVAMLANELESAAPQGVDGRVDGFVGTENDDRSGDLAALRPLHDFDAADVRQHQIEDDDIDIAAIQSVNRVLAGAAFFNESSIAIQQGSIGSAELEFIIDD